MSLVNLSHVCSHLQNASLARLGLTSIPYTKLHLSLSLLLHKQGFISHVKLAGPSPPASCFPPGVRDNAAQSSFPHDERGPRSGLSALTDMVVHGKRAEDLRREGYGDEAVDFAVRKRELSREQLEAEGWAGRACEFLIRNGMKSRTQLEDEGFDEEAISITEKYSVPRAMARLRERWDRDATAAAGVEDSAEEQQVPSSEVEVEPPVPYSRVEVEQQLRVLLRKEGFDTPTLQYFAQEQKYVTPRHLEQDGISVEAMGLTVGQQTLTPLPEQYQDPWGLETEGVVTQANRASRRLWLGMKYWNGVPVLSKARMLSKPTKRIWLDSRQLGNVVRGSRAGEIKGMTAVGEIMAVSTDRGVLEARECVERKIGGMVLCRIW